MMDQLTKRMNADEFSRRLQYVSDQPLHRFLGLKLEIKSPEQALVDMPKQET